MPPRDSAGRVHTWGLWPCTVPPGDRELSAELYHHVAQPRVATPRTKSRRREGEPQRCASFDQRHLRWRREGGASEGVYVGTGGGGDDVILQLIHIYSTLYTRCMIEDVGKIKCYLLSRRGIDPALTETFCDKLD
jgi:hypothetical protein